MAAGPAGYRAYVHGCRSVNKLMMTGVVPKAALTTKMLPAGGCCGAAASAAATGAACASAR